MWNAEVTHLGMHQTMYDPAIYERSTADSGADCEIDKVLQPACGPPARLTQSSGIHIGIERHWHAKLFPNRPHQIEIPPGAFRCRGYMPK